MKYTQYLSFEVSRFCNLAQVHADKCPVIAKRVCTGPPIKDAEIIRWAVEAYTDHGFTGMVCYHYYNEPLLHRDRIVNLCREIKRQHSNARFCLWTNGTLLDGDLTDLGVFDAAWISLYPETPRENVAQLTGVIPNTRTVDGALDNRLTARGDEHGVPCSRMFAELIVDNSGWVHVCCADYSGIVHVGNLRDGWKPVLEKWHRIRHQLGGTAMDENAPSFCRRCTWRSNAIPDFLPDIRERALYHQNRMNDPNLIWREMPIRKANRKTIVVFVHYRLPTKRLIEHLEWNAGLYEKSGVGVLVVTDRHITFPPWAWWAMCYPYPGALPKRDGRERFSLAMTKNYGIRKALDWGAEVVIATDADIAWSAPALNACAQVRDEEAVAPVYVMASSYAGRQARGQPLAPLAIGTVSMTATGWERCHYDERCVGYGSDDGILWDWIGRSGYRQVRPTTEDAPLWHVAHVEGSPQVEAWHKPDGPGRSDHHNRDLNPINFTENRKWMGQDYTAENWGRGELPC